ncbi:MAG: hypothetical protein GY741_16410 [Phycisphaeraceae bacterium]|jgi:hypothetical protein|nr:hypothetical protein [Phycisphaeraceae bacterium]
MADSYGYRYGNRVIVKKLLDSDSAAITAGDIITTSDATAGYVKEADATGELFAGVAVTSASSPSADGGAFVLVDVSQESVYEYPADSGTPAAADAGFTCDIAAARSINFDASATDNVKIHRVDTDASTLFVSFITDYAGTA